MGLADADSNAFLDQLPVSQMIAPTVTVSSPPPPSAPRQSSAPPSSRAIDDLVAAAGVDIVWNRQRYLELDIEQ